MNNKIIKMYNEIVGSDVICGECLDYNLEDYGLDSLMFIHLILALESEFSIQVPDELLIIGEFNTINKISKHIHSLKS